MNIRTRLAGRENSPPQLIFVKRTPDFPPFALYLVNANGGKSGVRFTKINCGGEFSRPARRVLMFICKNATCPHSCAGCGQLNLAHHTGPGEPAEVNALLENIELLQSHGVLS